MPTSTVLESPRHEPMSSFMQHLVPLFERERAEARPMVLATVIRTAGPSYTKAGAQMLISERGEYAGLLSGGCLEGDLSKRATRVLRTQRGELARYDMRGPDDLLFGLGSGCEGAMDILLQRLDATGDWQPMKRLVAAWRERRHERVLIVTPPLDRPPPATPPLPLGSGVFPDGGTAFGVRGREADALAALATDLPADCGDRLLRRELPDGSAVDLFVLEQGIQPHVLLLGAGADALPVAELAVFLGWRITVVDHRSHYARAARFPKADAVCEGGPQALPRLLQAASERGRFDAAIVMSHHLLTDAAYLRALAQSDIPYVGLLGPVVRRDRLLADIGADAARLRERLRAPVGLDLGGRSPEAIALSIVAEIQIALSATASDARSSRSGSSPPALVGRR